MVARGEVWWHEFPDERRRPYPVLTRDEGIPLLNQVFAAPATRTIRGIPSEVHLDGTDGMPVECVLTLDNLRVVRKNMLTGPVVEVLIREGRDEGAGLSLVIVASVGRSLTGSTNHDFGLLHRAGVGVCAEPIAPSVTTMRSADLSYGVRT